MTQLRSGILNACRQHTHTQRTPETSAKSWHESQPSPMTSDERHSRMTLLPTPVLPFPSLLKSVTPISISTNGSKGGLNYAGAAFDGIHLVTTSANSPWQLRLLQLAASLPFPPILHSFPPYRSLCLSITHPLSPFHHPSQQLPFSCHILSLVLFRLLIL